MPVIASAVLVRNLMDGPTVLASDPKGSEQVEWAGAGDSSGNDIQWVSDTLASSVPFVRALARGVLAVVPDETDPEAVEALQKQVDAFRGRNAATTQAAQASIEHTENLDFISIPCIGPSNKGQGACGADVTVRARDKDAKPALCETHSGLVNEYTPEQIQDGDKTATRWIRVTMGARQRQDG